MKDILENEIKVGDLITTFNNSSYTLLLGVVTKITPRIVYYTKVFHGGQFIESSRKIERGFRALIVNDHKEFKDLLKKIENERPREFMEHIGINI